MDVGQKIKVALFSLILVVLYITSMNLDTGDIEISANVTYSNE